MSIEERCNNALNTLKRIRALGLINCEEYHELIVLIGFLPQCKQERDEFELKLHKLSNNK